MCHDAMLKFRTRSKPEGISKGDILTFEIKKSQTAMSDFDETIKAKKKEEKEKSNGTA